MKYFFPNLESVCCTTSGSNCCFLTYRKISQEAGKVVWHSYLLKNFPQFAVIYTVKGFCIVSEAETFFFFSCNSLAFLDPVDVGNLISGCSAFSKSTCTSESSWIAYYWSLLKEFEHHIASMWNECNCAVVWTFFGIALPWDWNENWPFPVVNNLSFSLHF